MLRTRSVVAPIVAAIAVLLASAGAAVACLPYTFFDDEWQLERGVRWAVVGTVIRDEPNAGVPEWPTAMIVAVERTIVGHPGTSVLRIEQSDSCDGFWYRPGDQVVVALPAYDHFHDPPRPLPARLDHLQNDTVAVWVLDSERILLRPAGRSPMIDGHRFRSLDALLAALTRLPDTATVDPRPGIARSTGETLGMLAAAALAALATLRRLDGRRRFEPRRR
jgi:hypothetical protein